MSVPVLQLVFLDSFDHYDIDHMSDKWTVAAPFNIGPPYGRNGSGCNVGNGIAKTTKPLSSFTVGFASKINYGSGLGGILYSLNAVNAGGALVALIALHLLPDGTLAIFAGTTLLANPSTFTYTSGAWMYIEINVALQSGNPMAMSGSLCVNGNLIVNNVTVTSSVNVNGLLSGLPKGNYHNFGGGVVVGSTYIDDLYIADATGVTITGDGHGGALTGFYGDVKIGCIYPRQDVTNGFSSSAGSNGWSLLREHPPTSPSPDDDATYIFDERTGDEYTALFDTVTSTFDQIQAVQINIYARKDNEGTRALAWLYGSTEALSPDYFYLGDNYYYHTYPLANDWSVGVINITPFGIALIV